MANAVYPRYKAWKANGISPAAGYYLYTYVANSTVPKPTYTNAALSIANTNPVILDSNGEADIFLATGNYRFDLKTPAGALINTFDPVTSSSGSVIPTYANPSATIGLSAVNGVATDAMRSDGAPALSQAIAPTWSALHTFTPSVSMVNATNFSEAGTIYTSLLPSAQWDVLGSGFIFGGSNITVNTSGADQTAYAYKNVANLAGLRVQMSYSMRNFGSSSGGTFQAVSGIGIAKTAISTVGPPNGLSAPNSPRGAYTMRLTGPGDVTFLGFGGTSLVTGLPAPVGIAFTYTGIITIDIGPDTGGNVYDVTIRSRIPSLNIDMQTTIVGGINNAGAGTDGYICLCGPFNLNYGLNGGAVFTVSQISYGIKSTGFPIVVSDGQSNINGSLDWDGNAILNSVTVARNAIFGQGLTTTTLIGTGAATLTTIAGTSQTLSGSLTVGTTLLVTGVATFTAAPVFNSATASSAAAFDASKNLVSVANIGTGNNVLSVSPTFTGTVLVAAITTSGLLTMGVAPRFNGTNSTGVGTALLGSNSPAITLSAPYTWISAVSSDGSAVFIPCWK